MRHLLQIIAVVSAITIVLLLTECSNTKKGEAMPVNVEHSFPDTLHIGTLYSPSSYFLYREEEMGYDYELIRKFGRDKGIEITVTVAPNLNALVAMLDSGKVDIAAVEIPQTAEYNNKVLHCGPENITTQVLVQPRSDSMINDVTQLVGRTVYVEKGSKYFYRLSNLNNELGGGISIKAVNRDTLITEDLIKMVSDGTIPLTVVDSDIASLNRTYYPSLDISCTVSMEQKASWGVAHKNKWLANSIDSWASGAERRDEYREIHKRYFELAKNILPSSSSPALMAGKGSISKYDPFFRHYAATIGWDWRLLAAIACKESQFNPDVVSWAGAKGIMQIMPRTAAHHGLSADRITDPEANIATSVKILASLDDALKKRVTNPKERVKFILAAYNAGIAHIIDAITIAGKTGRNPQIWDNNVREALLLKSRPEYYNDPDVRYGYFRGSQTVEYVKAVTDIFNVYTTKIKK